MRATDRHTWTIWICQVIDNGVMCGKTVALQWKEGDVAVCPRHGELLGEDHGSLARPLDIVVVRENEVWRLEDKITGLEHRLTCIREAADG